MWIRNDAIRTKSINKSSESNYLIVNTQDKNPALRVSEKAQLELGWVKGDYVNVFVDKDKIMLVKDNDRKEFPIRIYKSRDKNYGFNLYGVCIKEVCKKFNWLSSREYPAEVIERDNQKILICFKNPMLSMAEKALYEKNPR